MCQDSKEGVYLNFVVNCSTTLTNAATLLTAICTTLQKFKDMHLHLVHRGLLFNHVLTDVIL